MNPIDKILAKLEYCIEKGTYEKVETDKYELKDNSHDSSDWKEVYKTTNAFLNTNGGILFIGIHEDEKNKKYIFKGFDNRNEEKIKEICKQFTNEKGEKLNLELYFPSYEIRNFLDGQILLIFVDSLPDDEKFVYFNNRAYDRQLTGDHLVSDQKIKAHEEYKQQIKDARELMPVINSSVEDLDIDKLNHYIFLLNRIKKTETQKSTIQDARSFLSRKMMIRDEQPTILGMLTCGKNPEDYLFNRCQIDCYVDHPSKELVARSRKLLMDTVINLMEEGERFIVHNIETGISIEKSGTGIYEYPIELIRESINNSLAHRDYSIDRFVTIKVVPKKQIEIRNPGRFKQQLRIEEDLYGKIPIRRIIPGDPQASNPRLANVLKVFNKWEGQGIGMATLTGACLHNQIDLPYYIFFSESELSLVIPSGKLLDKQMEALFEAYSGYINDKIKGQILSEEQRRVIAYLYKSEVANKLSKYTILLTKDNNHLDAIRSLLEAELIFPHAKSDNINPVYLLDRNLFQIDFTEQLESIFKYYFTTLKPDYKEILNLIYEANNFSKEKYLSANQIGNLLWVRQGKENIIEGFEDFKRKVRYIVSRLEKNDFIIRVSAYPQYSVNTNFKDVSLFSKITV
jgi:ATP-dependent DNA helicase RecG